MLPTLFFLFLCFGDVMTKLSRRYFMPLLLILFVVLFFNFKESFLKCRTNYHQRNGPEVFYWSGDFRPYYDLEPKLRKLGIKREDRTVSGYDYTDCASLYLMNQLGCTFGPDTPHGDVDSLINHPNTRYLVLNDSAKFRQEFKYDFSQKVIATHRGLIVYKIK
jgi:hypothetical protein